MKHFLTPFLVRFDRWPRLARLSLKTAIDGALVSAAVLGAVMLRFGAEIPAAHASQLLWLVSFVVVLKLLTFSYFNMSRDLWRYAGLNNLVRLVRVVGVSSLVVATFHYLVQLGRLPRSVFIIDAALTLILVGGARFAVRWIREQPSMRMTVPTGDGRTLQRVLLVGAGNAGEMMAREMRRRMDALRMDPIGFVDDDPGKQGMFIHGITVLGNRQDIPQIVREFKVGRIVLCLPAISAQSLREIVRYCRRSEAEMDIVPRIEEILTGEARISDVRELRVEDLLGREKIEFNMEQVCAYVQGRRILVTGAGGSIGSELCRQIVRYRPAEIVLLGRGENSIFDIGRELGERAPGVPRHEIIGDVINRKKLEGVFHKHRPEIIFHAGADKHVPLMETNPDEAVLNNVIGTMNVLDVADEVGTNLVVAISTDKAVRPTSVMGCCKRIAEMLVQSRPRRHTRAVAVRFGNVLGSRGSVIPVFKKQIENGGPLTITHPDIERYFMTIPEAVALVIQAGALGQGGELFVLDMGNPVRIVDLANEMIHLAGLEPEIDVPISFTGLRAGEKLNEELVGNGESASPTEHPKIMCLYSELVNPGWLDERVEELRHAAVAMDFPRIIKMLGQAVPDYAPAGRPATEKPEVPTIRAAGGLLPGFSGD